MPPARRGCGWWMVFGLGRLHIIREEDKVCAKSSSCSLTNQHSQWERLSGHKISAAGPELSLLYLYGIQAGPWMLPAQQQDDGLPVKTGCLVSSVLALQLDTSSSSRPPSLLLRPESVKMVKGTIWKVFGPEPLMERCCRCVFGPSGDHSRIWYSQ